MVKKNLLKFNLRIFLTIASVLSIIGLIFIYSASCIYASEKFGSPHYFLKKQSVFLLLSIVAFIIFTILPRKVIKNWSPYLFLLSLFAMLLTFVPSISLKVHGSNRWIGIFGFGLQPSEFLKLFLFMYLGLLFEKRGTSSSIKSYIPFFVALGVSFLILLKQPDFGSIVTIFITTVILFFVSGVKISHIVIAITSSIPVAFVAIYFKAYRLNRILVFLNPWTDPNGKGYQIIQSLIAIGSGGFWGLGISSSKQKFFYLPMQHTDFIFSIIAEETGFIGVIFIIALYFLFCLFGVKVALGMKEPFAFYTTLAFVILITLEAVINLMVATGLVPTKGLGLPFISYGGSALLSNFCMLGVIANFYRKQKA